VKNPFEYGGVVRGEAFCNRQHELADLRRSIENAEKLFVFSERRYGKTSLVRAVLDKLPRRSFVCTYVDLWPTDSEAAFAAALARAITESMSSSADKALQMAKRFFGSLSPTVTVDAEGKPSLSFGLAKHAQVDPVLEEVLETPARIARENGPRVAVVMDEFQQILEYGSDRVEQKLRSAIQNHRTVSYVFLGSRKHLIQKMVLDKNRPLFRAGGHYPLGPIAEKNWRPFVRERFSDAEKRIDDEEIHAICEMTQGHPFYTQHLCHVVWEMCERRAVVTKEIIDASVKILLDRESYAYTTLWESLTIPQKRFLKGLAGEAAGVKVFGGEFISRYGLNSASNAQRASETLLAKDVIDRDNGSFLITDRFFRQWIRSEQTI
jgi:hypothetical protein